MDVLLLTMEGLARVLGISERLAQEKERAKEPGFPVAVWLGPRTKRYRYADAVDYVARLPASPLRLGEPPQLARGRSAASLTGARVVKPSKGLSVRPSATPVLTEALQLEQEAIADEAGIEGT